MTKCVVPTALLEPLMLLYVMYLTSSSTFYGYLFFLFLKFMREVLICQEDRALAKWSPLYQATQLRSNGTRVKTYLKTSRNIHSCPENKLHVFNSNTLFLVLRSLKSGCILKLIACQGLIGSTLCFLLEREALFSWWLLRFEEVWQF